MKKSYSMYKIQLALELNEASGVYTVTSPDVSGLVTEGATPEEITHNVEEALQGLLEVWAELGIEAPASLREAQAVSPTTAEVLVSA
jgi:predicted RNase H-like HicB family nuclease